MLFAIFFKSLNFFPICWIKRTLLYSFSFETIVLPWNCFQSSFATDGKDVSELKLEKIGPPVSSFNTMPANSSKKNYHGFCSLVKLVGYRLLHNATGAYYVLVKALYWSFYVAGKLPTYPSPKPTRFESRWSPDFFFQASSFQLLKLENLLRWSFFIFT